MDKELERLLKDLEKQTIESAKVRARMNYLKEAIQQRKFKLFDESKK